MEDRKLKNISIGDFTVGSGSRVAVIAGPCVIESRDMLLKQAESIKRICVKNDIALIFKASFDKANRSSIDSFRGPGLRDGMRMLKDVKETFDVPVLSDIHLPEQADEAAEVLDVIQIPAFLCRQTDILVKAARAGKPVSVKKGQFMSPEEMGNVVNKIRSAGNDDILLTERGTTFGYNRLINDFRAIPIMKEFGCPVVYDATHSVQCPGGLGAVSGGESKYVIPLIKAAVAIGSDMVFMEVHNDPASAKSDGPNMLDFKGFEEAVKVIKTIEKAVRQ